MTFNVPHVDVRAKLAALEGQDIKDPSDWPTRERILKRHKDGKQLNGLTLPWSKTHDKIRLRPGEVSVWGGYNGHNKSTVLSQVATWAARGTKVGVGSFEMELEDTYNLMAQQAAGTDKTDSRWVNDFCTWCEDRIFVYDILEAIPSDQVLSGVDHMAGTLGCGLIIIDSLRMVRGIVDDMEKEADFLTLVTGLAKYYQTHIALVHHVKKPERGEQQIPDKYALRGNAAISDLAHSVFLTWSNKELKELRRKHFEGEPMSAEEKAKLSKDAEKADQLLIVAKQRHAPFEGHVGLWQHESRQFLGSSKKQPMLIDIPRLA